MRSRLTEPRPSGSGGLDDDTTAYILETRKYFEDLRQVAAQLAGLLVLSAAGSKSAGPHHPMLETADQLHQEATENLHQARVTKRAQPHHHYLLQAAASLRAALSAAHGGLEIDPILIPLRAAYAHLQCASNELPGFTMVAFEQGCCGRRA
ncbi:MAG TPA: hypothetical protein VLY24_06375 [Bryobacteraceae bacterium]|nr:hypothetical protein [Bryobacteraceae bacterium]